nr:hypothetical protein [uncultured Undibacterium sp.]
MSRTHKTLIKLRTAKHNMPQQLFTLLLCGLTSFLLQACGGGAAPTNPKVEEPIAGQKRDPLNDLVACNLADTYNAVTVKSSTTTTSTNVETKVIRIFKAEDRRSTERTNHTKFVFGNGMYLSPGTEMFSVDGVNWQRRLIDPKIKDVRSLIFVDGLFYALFDGQIASSRDGVNWTQTQLPISLAAIEFKDGTFVGITRAGNANSKHILLSSKDAKTWRARCSMPKQSEVIPSLNIVGNRIFTWGSIHLSSANGIDWSTSNVRTFSKEVAPFTEARFAYNDGKYFAYVNSTVLGSLRKDTKQCEVVSFEGSKLSYCNDIFISSDGVNWVENESPIAGLIYSVVSANNRLHLFSTNTDRLTTHSHSTDGKIWSIVPKTEFSPSFVSFNNGKWLGIEIGAGIEFIESSTDGINWQKLVTIPGTTAQAPIFVNDRFFIRADSYEKSMFLSIDQKFEFKKSADMADELNAGQLSFENGLFHLLGQEELLTSIDGKLWKTYPLAPGFLARKFSYGNGTFFVFGQRTGNFNTESMWADFVLTSNDGENWKEERSPFSGDLKAISYGAGRFVALVTTKDANYSDIYSSTDGRTWTWRNSFSGIDKIKFLNGKFVAFYKVIVGSNDGIVWTVERTEDQAGTDFYRDLNYGLSKYLLLSQDSQISTSEDLSNWTLRENRARGNLWGRSIGFGNGQFVAIDRSNLMTSQDGITWKISPYPDYDFRYIAFGNGVWIAVNEEKIYFDLRFD